MAAKKKELKVKSSGPTPWEKDEVEYPIIQGTCKVCGTEGKVKLAWDLRGYLCPNAGKCIARAVKNPPEVEALEG